MVVLLQYIGQQVFQTVAEEIATPNTYLCSYISLIFCLYSGGWSIRPDKAQAERADLNKEAPLTVPITKAVVARRQKKTFTSQVE